MTDGDGRNAGSDGDRHVTERDLHSFRDYLDERFRSHRNQMLLYMGIAVGLIRFDLPEPITVGVILGVIAKGSASVIWHH